MIIVIYCIKSSRETYIYSLFIFSLKTALYEKKYYLLHESQEFMEKVNLLFILIKISSHLLQYHQRRHVDCVYTRQATAKSWSVI